MVVKESGVEGGFLFGGVSIDFSTHNIQSAEDMVGFTVLGAFKDHVFNEMAIPCSSSDSSREPCLPAGQNKTRLCRTADARGASHYLNYV
jgi:hypothetical protein